MLPLLPLRSTYHRVRLVLRCLLSSNAVLIMQNFVSLVSASFQANAKMAAAACAAKWPALPPAVVLSALGSGEAPLYLAYFDALLDGTRALPRRSPDVVHEYLQLCLADRPPPAAKVHRHLLPLSGQSLYLRQDNLFSSVRTTSFPPSGQSLFLHQSNFSSSVRAISLPFVKAISFPPSGQYL